MRIKPTQIKAAGFVVAPIRVNRGKTLAQPNSLYPYFVGRVTIALRYGIGMGLKGLPLRRRQGRIADVSKASRFIPSRSDPHSGAQRPIVLVDLSVAAEAGSY